MAVEMADIEDSGVLANAHLAMHRKIVSSLIDSHTRIGGDEHARPKGMRLILGEHGSNSHVTTPDAQGQAP